MSVLGQFSLLQFNFDAPYDITATANAYKMEEKKIQCPIMEDLNGST